MNMSRRSLVLGAGGGLLAVSLLAGCSATGSPASGSSAESVAGSTIVVYSPQGADTRGPYISEQAQKDLGVTVQFVAGAGGDLTTRLLAEKNNTQADVVLGLGEAQMNQVADAGILQPYTPSWGANVPEELRGSYEDFTLATQTPIVMAYNADAMSASDAPSSWLDLAQPQYKDKFTFPAITSQTGQAAAVGILWNFTDPATGEVSDEGWDTLTKITSNSVQMSAGQKFDYGTVASGAEPIVITYLGGLQTAEKDNGLSMQIIDPEGGSPYVQTGVGLVKSTTHTAAAQAFIDWFGSAEFQVPFVTATNNDTPVNSDAVDQLGEVSDVLSTITKQDIDWAVVTTNLPDWLQRIQLGGAS